MKEVSDIPNRPEVAFHKGRATTLEKENESLRAELETWKRDAMRLASINAQLHEREGIFIGLALAGFILAIFTIVVRFKR